MQLECVFFGPFREDVGDKTVIWDEDVDNVGELLRELEAAYPVLSGRLLDSDGSGMGGLAEKTVVTKNKTDIRHLEGLDTPLEDGDVLRLVPSVYGG
ncbi:MoaD/ThiS family protein [Halobacteria archaeon AArc-curdl1]|uniref:MoaD/ThiS family protein n=1 Tax=Natronosalvus hydrolyticus TaxID=2979988 RepID=A0AAP2ZBJ0_9EURY|nr:MoaD/ThiS family protein [Halobacteria archaeon AArc-curdl1]